MHPPALKLHRHRYFKAKTFAVGFDGTPTSVAHWLAPRRSYFDPASGRLQRAQACGRVALWCCFRAYHYKRTCRCTSWASDRSLVDHDCKTSARTAIRHHKYLVFVALPSASCRLTVGARDAYRAFTGRRASRSRRTLLALRAGRSWWARRSRRTGLALFTRRPCRPGLPLRALSAAG